MRYHAALAALLLSTAPVSADMRMPDTVILGDLHIESPMLRETPPNAPVGAGYLTIVNTGDHDDRLISASVAAEVAADVQLHRMAMADGVMTMSMIEDGIPVPAGGTVTLASGGDHLMIRGLEEPLKPGDSHAITLGFETAGTITLDMPVMTLAEIRTATGEAGAMDHSADHSTPDQRASGHAMVGN